MNEFLYRDRMHAINDLTGIFSSRSNVASKSKPQTSYQETLAKFLKPVEIPEVSTGRTLTLAESYAAAKSIYRTNDENQLLAVQKTINIGAAIQDDIDRDSMSMSEYKRYITTKIGSLPMDYTHQDDNEFIKISDAGWKEMKSNINYEAWILGYLKQDFSFHNPWYGVGSVRGNIVIENFGASVNEHRGQSEAKIDPVEAAKDASEAAERRRKKRKEMLELEEELLTQKRIAEHVRQIKSTNTLDPLNRFDLPQVDLVGFSPIISASLVVSFST